MFNIKNLLLLFKKLKASRTRYVNILGLGISLILFISVIFIFLSTLVKGTGGFNFTLFTQALIKLSIFYSTPSAGPLKSIKILDNKYPNFSLNLLPEMDKLVNAEILLLSIFLNMFIASQIIKIDYSKYLPDNKLGNILKTLIIRYIKVWSKSQNIMLIICWVILLICVMFSKFCLYHILYTP